jgi:hypothetical protein
MRPSISCHSLNEGPMGMGGMGLGISLAGPQLAMRFTIPANFQSRVFLQGGGKKWLSYR